MKPSTLPSLVRRPALALCALVLSLLGLCALAAPASASTVATTTVVTSSANPATVAQTVTFTAVVDYSPGHSVPGGYVDFAVPGTYMFLYSAQQEALACNQVPIENGVATCEVAGGWELAGADTVSAKYLGATGYATSSGTLAETVQNTATQFATSTSVTSSVNPSVVGQTVAFTAHVGWSNDIGSNPSVGSVEFVATGNPILPGVFSGNTLETFGCAAVPLTDGSATCTTYAGWAQTGTYTVTAIYLGTQSAQASVGSVTQTVGQAATVVSCTYSSATQTASVTVGPASPSIYDAGITGTVVTQTYVNILGNPAYNQYFTGTYSGTALTVNESSMASLATLIGTMSVPVTFTSTSPNWAGSTGTCTIT